MGKRSKGFKRGALTREPGGFCAWPRNCARSENYRTLSKKAKALLFDLLGQYSGNNNGDLTCAFSVMRDWNWHSSNTLARAARELETTGWIIRTRQGGRNRCNLYALTFHETSACQDRDGNPKMDAHIKVNHRYDYWKLGYNPEIVEQDEAA